MVAWYIYLHENHKNQEKDVGKYTSPMDPLGNKQLDAWRE